MRFVLAQLQKLGLGFQTYGANMDKGAPMKISTVREFRENAAGMLRAKDPILVTRRGRLAGIFFPSPEATLPSN